MVRLVTLSVALIVLVYACACAVERFPPPDFTSGHKLPITTTPPPRSPVLDFVDMGVLAAALGASAYFALGRRSRKGVIALAIFSVAYFGFFRKGCICPIGAIQNVVLSISDSTYALPMVAGIFFVLPLLAALLFGRVFCAGVCPLGCAQDLVLLRPAKVAKPLEHALGILPWVYLGTAAAFTAASGAFLICRFDPIVPFFRFGGSALMLTIGAAVIVLAMFVGRPYCRFGCPYGALLRLLAPLTKWRVTITPDECINCKLCEDACPFGQIRRPTPPQDSAPVLEGKSRLLALLGLLPVIVALGAVFGYLAGPQMARIDPRVRLADRVWLESHHKVRGTTLQTDALKRQNREEGDVYAAAVDVRKQFVRIGPFLGGWVGLVVGLNLLGLSVRRRRTEYEADSAGCVACARCYNACPVERARHGDAEAIKLINEVRGQ
jgi:NosR/NirI family transcriptional regulator, nitrous oxide reductase regulator